MNKCTALNHISAILFLWVYYKFEIKKLDCVFRKKIVREAVKEQNFFIIYPIELQDD
jgi:hypothetical protein